MKLGKPIKYLAVQPGEVVERVKKIVRCSSDNQIKKLEELKSTDVLTELNLLHKQGVEFVESGDLSGAIRGRPNIYDHLELMVKNAKNSITIVTTAKGLKRKVEALKPEFERLAKKGVKIRIAAPLNKDTEAVVKDLSKVADVRHINPSDMSARFAIVDSKDLMFMVMDDEEVHPTYDIGIWTSTEFFAKALNQMFDVTWKNLK